MAEFFGNNLGGAINEGRVTREMVDEWLALAYPDDTETQETKRNLIWSPDGSIVKYQCQVVYRLARDAESGETARLEELAREMREAAAKPEVPEELLADVPEPEPEPDRPDIAAEIRRRISMTDAVNRWGKPQTTKHGHLSESNKIRCPFPDHNDANPSAWYDADGKWNCGACSKGGDVITYFAARQFGYDQADAARHFVEVTQEMARQLGWEIYKSALTGDWEMVAEEDDPVPLPDRPEEEVAAPSDETPAVPPSFEASEPVTISDEEMEMVFSSIRGVEWREYGINPGSFLGEWMQHAERYFPWAPPEFFFFVGLQAVGMAAGHHVYTDSAGATNLNLMVTLIGSSGAGKSTAVGELVALIARSDAAFDEADKTGIKELPNPGSAEALISSIQNIIKTDTGEIEVPSTAWLVVDEFADFVSKANRKGASNMKTLLQQLYDFRKRTSAPERSINWYSEGRGFRTLTDHHFTATFTTQLSSLRALLTSVDINSGFVGRIIPVVGVKRHRRKYKRFTDTSSPDLDLAFNALWHRCRDGVRRPIEFTDETFAYMDGLDEFEALESGVIDDLMTRAHLFIFKIAALFALNNGESVVTIEYFKYALRLMREFIIPSFAAIESAAKATDVDDLGSELIEWVRNFYLREGYWPKGVDINRAPFSRKGNNELRAATLDVLHKLHRLVTVKVLKESGKGAPTKYYVLPEMDDWAWCADIDSRGALKHNEFVPGGPK